METDNQMVALCREVCKRNGKVAVYEIKEPVTNDLLAMLTLRCMINPELRYFITPRVRWNGVWHDDYYRLLKRKSVTDEDLKRMGGIVEIR